MIIVTDEMVQAFSRVFFRDPLGIDVRAGLRAVIAIIERDFGQHLRCEACASGPTEHNPYPWPGEQ